MNQPTFNQEPPEGFVYHGGFFCLNCWPARGPNMLHYKPIYGREPPTVYCERWWCEQCGDSGRATHRCR